MWVHSIRLLGLSGQGNVRLEHFVKSVGFIRVFKYSSVLVSTLSMYIIQIFLII